MMRQESAHAEAEPQVHPRARTVLYRGGQTGVLLLHGLAGSTEDLRETAEYIHSLGFTVLNARIAGHGTTPKQLSETTEDAWRQSALAALALLREHAQRFFLLGFSFGGSLAIDLLVREPYGMLGIILVGMPIRTANERTNRLLLPLARRKGKQFTAKPWVKDPKIAETYLMQGKYIVMPVSSYERLLHFVAAYTKPQLAQVRVPALLLYSPDDYATDPRSAEYVLTHLGSEEKELFWVRGKGTQHHLLRSEKQQLVHQKIATFLTTHSSVRR